MPSAPRGVRSKSTGFGIETQAQIQAHAGLTLGTLALLGSCLAIMHLCWRRSSDVKIEKGRPVRISAANRLTEDDSFCYGYDTNGNLIDKTVKAAGGFAGAPESYAYDEEGNRTVSHLSGAHLTDAANRLLEDDTFSYDYDANGNLKTKADRATPTDITTYTWDVRNRLVRIDMPGGGSATYRYDADGRRIEKDVT